MALVIAIGVRESGERTLVRLDIGGSEEGAFWSAFLPSLLARGLRGVELVMSDAHSGVKEAIGALLSSATWQRCRVHSMRNVLAQVPQHDKAMVAAAFCRKSVAVVWPA